MIRGGLTILFCAATCTAAPLAEEARGALHRATAYMQSISTRGGYLWWYSEDLRERAGESKAKDTQIWVQPPGTPAVGMAFLRAFEVTKDRRYLAAAEAAAEALAWGQLESGGWTYQIDFDPANQRFYRRAEKGNLSGAQMAGRRNVTTFDDNTTQSALEFLMAVIEAGVKHPEIRMALDYGLEGLLRAQYANGAWPQGFDGKPRDAANHPAKPAQMPKEWSRTPDVKDYWFQYTFNDGAMRDCIRTALEAHRRLKKPEYLEGARRAGDFILRAQLPAPQSGWAQQYNFAMEPAWARKFEPPSVSSGETAGIIRTLVDIYLATGEEKYLKPIPAAIDWLKRSEIAPGKWARFNELGSNKPLYFTKDYRLVYTDDELPTHYAFQGEFGIPSAIKYYENVRGAGREAWLKESGKNKVGTVQALRAREVIEALDNKGRWLKNGRIETRVFIANVNTLCDYLQAQAMGK
jgi:PelA/Pel-15E family pectate lyase